ncbi:MAG: BREX-1 system phosphatase PglZ type A [Bifidobacteriaceae bacterium]|jgi:uncharacterized protein (TIGR02687 family)|nr:BREX-1 system phosphatase PglZ type A [Bifidobacteriaceae bacterium]
MSPLDSIERQLQQRFESPESRVVIWSDPPGEYEAQVDLLSLPGVEVLRVAGNEFGIKHRVLFEEPGGRFLIYRAGLKPTALLDNWLLDLELSHGVFAADRASLVEQELGDASGRLRDVVERYPAFFKAAKRVEALKGKLAKGDRPEVVTAKMIQVVIGSEDHTLQSIWRRLMEENALGKTSGIEEVSKLGLADFHWKGTAFIYGYRRETPTVDDFVLWLFDLDWHRFASETPGEFRNIQIDFGYWSNDQRFAKAFRDLSERAADDLGIEGRVAELSLSELLSRSTFRHVDERIIDQLAIAVDSRTLPDRDVQDAVRRRAVGTWYAEYQHLYEAVAAASTVLTLIDALPATLPSPADAFRRYVDELYLVDQAYRHFTLHADLAEASSPLENLKAKVEGFYSTKYLARIGAAWQAQVDTLDKWHIFGISGQRAFFSERVQPFIDRGTRAVVIVSDALRYEVAEELGRRIREEDRFDAELTAMLSTFPSYTQLGMASLLPHENLAFNEGEMVLVDGNPSDGTRNRARILAAVSGSAIQSADFMKLPREDARDLVKAHQVLYIYHNQIDEAGDHVSSEGRVFRAVQDTLVELVRLVKKLAGGTNVSNIIVTADHGFLYQDSGLDESGYLSVRAQGDKLLVANNRRFVLGYGLKRDPAFITYTSAELGMEGDVEAQVPKSIHRLRVAGSGSKYVHGGTALQEVVVPVLAVSKKRSSDTRQVDVKVLAMPERITTGQVAVTLFQESAVSEKVKPITLVAGLYAGETLISNEVTIEFSQASSDKRDRYHEIKLILNRDADGFNNQLVELRLAEPIPGTARLRPYHHKARSTLVRTFTSDFDF